MKLTSAMILIAALLAVAQNAFAETALFQQGTPNQFALGGYYGVEDTAALYTAYSYEDFSGNNFSAEFPNQNYGGSPLLYVGYSQLIGPLPGFSPPPGTSTCTQTGRGVGLIRFDVTALAGRTIQSARLRMSMSGSPDPSCPIGGYLPVPAEDAAWVAGTGDNAIESGASCWSKKRYSERGWASDLLPKGMFGPDPAGWSLSTPTGRSWPADDPLAESVYREVYFDLDPKLVSSWAAHPNENGGLRFIAWGSALTGNLVIVPSSEFENVELRPALEVTYVPEPSALAFLAGASATLVCVSRMRQIR